LTAVDASAEMLALNRARVTRPDVRYVQRDLFAWMPDQRYDVVFFSAWLSHVPPQRFNDFWSRVDAALVDDGRVFLIDELPAIATIEQRIGNTIAVERTLSDGRTYRAVKVLHEPAELERLLSHLGWNARATTVGRRLFYATAARAPRLPPE
jgi:demethylmenaquinone methyltransferase/2-methoxy-6-polyprenyl-1,4-benzoquinol methylase